MSLIKILSVPLYKVGTDLDNSKIIKALDDASFRPFIRGISQSIPNLQDNEEFSDLVQLIDLHYNQYMDLIEQPRHKYKIVGMWANMFKGGPIQYHSHQNSFISGVYYVKQSNPPTPTIFTSLYPESIRLTNNIVIDEFTPCEEGSLVMFPSFLPHFADPCEDRITISWNILPYELGNQFNLNHAKLFE